jgi:hypothetical protein
VSVFPVLKTGAVAQYPFERSVEFATEVLRFVDGSEQRFRRRGGGRRWVIRLELLDEEELARIEDFYLTEQGRAGSFSFTDPFDGIVYPDCSLDSESVEMSFDDIRGGSTALAIRQNRS